MVALRQIEQFSVSFASGDTSKTHTLATTLLDTSKAALFFGIQINSATPTTGCIDGNITNTTTVTFTRDGTGIGAEIVGYVVEWTSGVIVERGVALEVGENTDGKFIPLNSITDISKAFCLGSCSQAGTSYGDDEAFALQLTEPDGVPTLHVWNNNGDNPSANLDRVAWQVVQYTDCNVQRGEETGLVIGVASESESLSSAVDLDKSFIICYVREGAIILSDCMVRSWLGSTTQINFERDSSDTGINGPYWEVVEFTDGTTVQRVSEPFAVDVVQENATINAVSNGVAFTSTAMRWGTTNYEVTDLLGECSYITDITTSTNVQIDRATSNDTSTVEVFVVDFTVGDIPIVIQPDAGSVSLTGLVPITDATDDKSFAPDLATLSITNFVPTVDAEQNAFIQPAFSNILATGFVPVSHLTDHKTLNIAASALDITKFLPAISLGPLNVSVGVSEEILTGFNVATALGPFNIPIELSNALITGFAPVSRLGPYTISVGESDVAVTGLIPGLSVSEDRTIDPDFSQINLAGFETMLGFGPLILNPTHSDMGIDGFANIAHITDHETVMVAQSEVSLTGFQLTIKLGPYTIAVVPCSLTLAGLPPISHNEEDLTVESNISTLISTALIPTPFVTNNVNLFPNRSQILMSGQSAFLAYGPLTIIPQTNNLLITGQLPIFVQSSIVKKVADRTFKVLKEASLFTVNDIGRIFHVIRED